MLGLAREERTMNKTRRAIGLTALVILVGLGAGWALEQAYSAQAQRGLDIREPAKPSEGSVTPISVEPSDVQPVTTEPSQEYDRSDLLLIFG
jgi:hypothetical protein